MKRISELPIAEDITGGYIPIDFEDGTKKVTAEELSPDILSTGEEVEANTEPGNLVDALVYKEQLQNGIQLGIQDGSPVWKERGADTWSPFKGALKYSELKQVSVTIKYSYYSPTTIKAANIGLSQILGMTDVQNPNGSENTESRYFFDTVKDDLSEVTIRCWDGTTVISSETVRITLIGIPI